jgi:UDP-galactopyranose mutase
LTCLEFFNFEENTEMESNSLITQFPRDVICLSHLRWGFVYQRPQHLLSRFARGRRVFFVEEPISTDGTPQLDMHTCPESGVNIVVPRVPTGLGPASQETILKLLLNKLIADHDVTDYLLWYYTPMALSFSRHLNPRAVVFDCMDELSGFQGAPQEMKDREAELMARADLVFTGGQSLYEAKVGRHDHLFCFPSSIEFGHFSQARSITVDPSDQAEIPHPRIGFAGVVDERMNIELLRQMADLRPDWQFIMVGPVVKIDPQTLPKNPNIHWLGGKAYKELPAYLAGWDVAMLPFAHNDSTKFISPTKTPEYLAAGRPVVSTSITDVVRPYATEKLVRIADTPEEFVRAISECMEVDAVSEQWRARVDQMLAQNSWDLTWQRMCSAIESRITSKETIAAALVGVTAGLRPSASGD